MLHRMLLAGALALLVVPAQAGVITVDDDGGADFTDLPPAVAAAAAGDTLFVAAGSYSAFTIDAKPLTVMGLDPGQVVVQGTSRVNAVAAPGKVVLCQLDLERLALSNSTGAIVLDTVRVFGASYAMLSIAACDDVRAIGSQIDPHPNVAGKPWLLSTVRVDDAARLEATECVFQGIWANFPYYWHALHALGGSRLHLAASSARGGQGASDGACGPGWCEVCPGFPGGNAVRLEEASFLRAAGMASDLIEGGLPGDPKCGKTQSCAIRATGAGTQAVWSGVTVQVLDYQGSPCSMDGATIVEASTPDPWLEREHTPLAGGQARFYAYGEPGDVATLFVGRSAVVVPLPGVEVEQLTSEERSFAMGTMGANGAVSFAFTVPPLLPKGFTFFAQARILRNGVELRTNSVPVVLR